MREPNWFNDAREAGWVSPRQQEEAIAEIQNTERNAAVHEFERLVALGRITPEIGEHIITILRKEIRYGRH